MRKNNKKQYFLIYIFVLVIAMSTYLSAFASSTDKKDHVVRVAYAHSDGYQEGNEGEYKTGFGYEYLQRIAEITGWKYEYVYGTFSELLGMLEKGEIDLMGNLSYTEERAQNIDYSMNEQGKENYYLYVDADRNIIDEDDLSSINGKTIGVNTSSFQKEIWDDWCLKHGIKYKLKEYKTLTDCGNALNKGEIDGLLYGEVIADNKLAQNWRIILKYGSFPFYFGVNQKRPDLLSALNKAQNKILEDTPLYNEEVYNRYIASRPLISAMLSEDEDKWLEQNGGIIKVGYLSNYMPLSGKNDKGEFCGIAADVLSFIEQLYKKYNLTFQPIEYTDYDQMLSDLKNETISAACPVYSDYWNADQDGVILTNRFMSTAMMFIFDETNIKQKLTRIGICGNGSLEDVYAKINYSASDIVRFDSSKEAVNAVKSGAVDGLLYATCCYNVDSINNSGLRDLSNVSYPKNAGVSMAVSQNKLPLMTIINKGLDTMNQDSIYKSLFVNSQVEKEVSIKEYIAQHPLQAILFAGTMILLFAGIMIYMVYNKMSEHIRESKREKEIYEKLLNRDVLTGLLNRRAYEDMMEKITSEPEKHADAVLLMLDINGLKRENDIGGHIAGDEFLIKAAAEFTKIYKSSVFRITGDNFAVIDEYGEYKNKYPQIKLRSDIDQEPIIVSQGFCPLKKEDGTFRTLAEWKKDTDLLLYADKLANKSAINYSEDQKVKAFVKCVNSIVEAKDQYTADHSDRVRKISILLAVKMGLSNVTIEHLSNAAELHDIGKIGVRDMVLQKPERLTDDEYVEMKKHAGFGANILSNSIGMNEIASIVRHHHERYDGKGYPDGLSGTDIPIESRIIAIADSIDAMTSSRCYRKALSADICYHEIEKNLGTMYDPAIGKIALNNWKEIMEIQEGNV